MVSLLLLLLLLRRGVIHRVALIWGGCDPSAGGRASSTSTFGLVQNGRRLAAAAASDTRWNSYTDGTNILQDGSMNRNVLKFLAGAANHFVLVFLNRHR